MNLQSPIFDKVRVPSQVVLASLIERICIEHGADVEKFRCERHEYVSDQVMALRRDVLIAARDAGYSIPAIAQWFRHQHNGTVSRWIADFEAARS